MSSSDSTSSASVAEASSSADSSNSNNNKDDKDKSNSNTIADHGAAAALVGGTDAIASSPGTSRISTEASAAHRTKSTSTRGPLKKRKAPPLSDHEDDTGGTTSTTDTTMKGTTTTATATSPPSSTPAAAATLDSKMTEAATASSRKIPKTQDTQGPSTELIQLIKGTSFASVPPSLLSNSAANSNPVAAPNAAVIAWLASQMTKQTQTQPTLKAPPPTIPAAAAAAVAAKGNLKSTPALPIPAVATVVAATAKLPPQKQKQPNSAAPAPAKVHVGQNYLIRYLLTYHSAKKNNDSSSSNNDSKQKPCHPAHDSLVWLTCQVLQEACPELTNQNKKKQGKSEEEEESPEEQRNQRHCLQNMLQKIKSSPQDFPLLQAWVQDRLDQQPQEQEQDKKPAAKKKKTNPPQQAPPSSPGAAAAAGPTNPAMDQLVAALKRQANAAAEEPQQQDHRQQTTTQTNQLLQQLVATSNQSDALANQLNLILTAATAGATGSTASQTTEEQKQQPSLQAQTQTAKPSALQKPEAAHLQEEESSAVANHTAANEQSTAGIDRLKALLALSSTATAASTGPTIQDLVKLDQQARLAAASAAATRRASQLLQVERQLQQQQPQQQGLTSQQPGAATVEDQLKALLGLSAPKQPDITAATEPARRQSTLGTTAAGTNALDLASLVASAGGGSAARVNAVDNYPVSKLLLQAILEGNGNVNNNNALLAVANSTLGAAATRRRASLMAMIPPAASTTAAAEPSIGMLLDGLRNGTIAQASSAQSPASLLATAAQGDPTGTTLAAASVDQNLVQLLGSVLPQQSVTAAASQQRRQSLSQQQRRQSLSQQQQRRQSLLQAASLSTDVPTAATPTATTTNPNIAQLLQSLGGGTTLPSSTTTQETSAQPTASSEVQTSRVLQDLVTQLPALKEILFSKGGRSSEA